MRKLVVLFASLVILFAMFGALGFGQGKYTPKPNEEIYGTWVNEEMNPPKTANNPDGTFADYFPASYAKPYEGGNREIVKKWTDSEGSVWYNCYDTFTAGSIKGHKVQNLWKISRSGTVAEFVWTEAYQFDPSNFPTKLDPKSPNYFIFYRAAK